MWWGVLWRHHRSPFLLLLLGGQLKRSFSSFFRASWQSLLVPFWNTRERKKKKKISFHFYLKTRRRKIPAATWLVTFISHELDVVPRVCRDLRNDTTRLPGAKLPQGNTHVKGDFFFQRSHSKTIFYQNGNDCTSLSQKSTMKRFSLFILFQWKSKGSAVNPTNKKITWRKLETVARRVPVYLFLSPRKVDSSVFGGQHTTPM